MSTSSLLKNDRLIRALLKQPVDRTPIWIMRQAGRYLPEYRKIRQSVSGFMELCQNPELAAEVTLQPLKRFDLDAAILFSDILTIPNAMGLSLSFQENEGPKFSNPVRTLQDVNALRLPDIATDLNYVLQTIKNVKQALNHCVPLIGFSGSPWTLATYMVEGGASKTFSQIKKMLYAAPALLHDLLSRLTQSVIAYLNAQIAAGVNVVMLFDTWGGILTKDAYLEFSLAYMQTIIAGLTAKNTDGSVPSIVFTKGGGLWLEEIAAIGCTAVGLDWTINIADAKNRIGAKTALQGNLDPSVLYAPPAIIQREARKILSDFAGCTGHVFNLGHGIHPDSNPDHVNILVDAVRDFSL